MVRETGLEPVRTATHAPQTCASAYSATLASLISRSEQIELYQTVRPMSSDLFIFYGNIFSAVFKSAFLICNEPYKNKTVIGIVIYFSFAG